MPKLPSRRYARWQRGRPLRALQRPPLPWQPAVQGARKGGRFCGSCGLLLGLQGLDLEFGILLRIPVSTSHAVAGDAAQLHDEVISYAE